MAVFTNTYVDLNNLSDEQIDAFADYLDGNGADDGRQNWRSGSVAEIPEWRASPMRLSVPIDWLGEGLDAYLLRSAMED
jgi:hypothetical protein